jgi:outer membrane lipoprotein-sorting protein
MRSKTAEPRIRFAAVSLCAGFLAFGCGESPEERRAAVQAEAEREFGRRAEPNGPPDGSEVADPADSDRAPSTPVEETSTGASVTAEPPPVTPVESTGQAADTVASPPESDPRIANPSAPPLELEETEPPTGQEPTAESILADADGAYSGLASLRASFVQRVDLPLVDRSAQGHGVWLQEGRDRFRMDFTEPADDLFVADGEFLWLYQPSATPGQVIKSALTGGGQAAGGADVLGRILSEARASYDAVLEGSAIVSGVRTHVISLTPRGPSEYRLVRVWIADSDRLVRRFRIEEENETIRTVTLADLEPNASVDGALFAFTVPDGVQVFER